MKTLTAIVAVLVLTAYPMPVSPDDYLDRVGNKCLRAWVVPISSSGVVLQLTWKDNSGETDHVEVIMSGEQVSRLSRHLRLAELIQEKRKKGE